MKHSPCLIRSIFTFVMYSLVACIVGRTSFASVITIQDPGFENRVVTSPSGYTNFNATDPWKILGFSAGAGLAKPPSSQFPGLSASSGNQFGASINASFYQTLGVSFDPGFSYRLEFDVAPSTSNANGSGFIAGIETVDGGALKQIQEVFSLPLGTSWVRKAVVFDPTVDSFSAPAVGSPLRIHFSGFHPTSIADSAGFDNVTLVSTPIASAPEPSSALLLTLFFASILLLKNRSFYHRQTVIQRDSIPGSS